MGERILNKEEQAYKNMEAVCGILNALCKTDTVYTVGVTYLDFGQDWKWTTILNNKGVQILTTDGTAPFACSLISVSSNLLPNPKLITCSRHV